MKIEYDHFDYRLNGDTRQIPKQEYEEIYAMLHIEASGNVSQEDFVTRNSAIYEGIEVQNMVVQIIAYDEEQMAVTYQTSFDTVAGTISFENEALFLRAKMDISWFGMIP